MGIGKQILLRETDVSLLVSCVSFLVSFGGHPSVALLREEAAAPTGRRSVVLVRARARARARIRGRVRMRVRVGLGLGLGWFVVRRRRHMGGGSHGAHGVGPRGAKGVATVRATYGTPQARPRHAPGTPQARPRHAPGTPQARPRHAPGTPQARPRHAPGTPQARPRHAPGTPQARPRHAPGTPQARPRHAPGTPQARPRHAPGTPQAGMRTTVRGARRGWYAGYPPQLRCASGARTVCRRLARVAPRAYSVQEAGTCSPPSVQCAGGWHV